MFAHRRYFNPVILNVVENFAVNFYILERKREMTVNSVYYFSRKYERQQVKK